MDTAALSLSEIGRESAAFSASDCGTALVGARTATPEELRPAAETRAPTALALVGLEASLAGVSGEFVRPAWPINPRKPVEATNRPPLSSLAGTGLAGRPGLREGGNSTRGAALAYKALISP